MSKTMEPELVEALKQAGMQIIPQEEQLSPEQRVEKLLQLETKLQMAKESKEEKLAKKIRRQMRKLGFYRSQYMKVQIG